VYLSEGYWFKSSHGISLVPGLLVRRGSGSQALRGGDERASPHYCPWCLLSGFDTSGQLQYLLCRWFINISLWSHQGQGGKGLRKLSEVGTWKSDLCRAHVHITYTPNYTHTHTHTHMHTLLTLNAAHGSILPVVVGASLRETGEVSDHKESASSITDQRHTDIQRYPTMRADTSYSVKGNPD